MKPPYWLSLLSFLEYSDNDARITYSLDSSRKCITGNFGLAICSACKKPTNFLIITRGIFRSLRRIFMRFNMQIRITVSATCEKYWSETGNKVKFYQFYYWMIQAQITTTATLHDKPGPPPPPSSSSVDL